MLNDLTIKQKIIYSFSIVLLLFILLAGYSLYSIQETAKSFKNYREMAQDVVLASRVQANMLMLTKSVEEFLKQPSREKKQDISLYYNKTNSFIQIAKQQITKQSRDKMVAELEVNLKKYRAAFNEVEQLFYKRNVIVYKHLDINGKKIEQLLTKVMKSANKDGDVSSAFDIAQDIRALLLARLYTAKFLMSNSVKNFNRVNKEFSALSKLIIQTRKNLQDEQRREFLSNAAQLIQLYKADVAQIYSIINRRNQIIESELHIIAPKINKVAEKIKLSIKKNQDEIGPHLSNIFDFFKWTLLLFIVITVIIVIFFFYFVPQTILIPLQQLNNRIIDLIKTENVNKKIPINTHDEIAEVINNFNLYLEKQNQLIQSRENFLRYVSHELKTPITKGNFLIDRLKNNYDDSTMKELENVLKDFEEFIEKFLEIEKLKFSQFEIKSFKISSLLMEALSKLTINNESLLKLDIKEDFTISGDFYYTSLAIKNLIDNALKYSSQFPIYVITTNTYAIEIINYGKPLENELSYYLSPFHRDQKDAHVLGHGLGLGFAFNALKLQKFHLHYEFNRGKNYFRIIFKEN